LKTKIITLESHDDLISVRDKLSWAKTPRILLVWPKYEKVTLRVLDLKVLQRHADSLGAQLGLVTRRANVRHDAESLGIPVFISTSSAQKDLWPDSAARSQRIPKPPRRDLRQLRDDVYPQESAWRTSLLGRVITFSAGVMAVLVVAGIFVPRAEVTLYPKQQMQAIDIPVTASTSFTSVSITGSIPATSISVTVTGDQTLAITSEIALPGEKATGIARFTNLGNDAIEIPAGTIVSTSGLIRFGTLNNTRLPGGTDQFVEVRIEAVQGGANGNVAIDSITVVEGVLGTSMTVNNPDATSGGTDHDAVGPSGDNRTKLRQIVLDNLRTTAETQLRAQLQPGDLLLEDTISDAEILQEDFSPPEGQEGKTLSLKMEAQYSARYVLDKDLHQLAASTLGGSAPDGYSTNSDVTYQTVSNPVTDSEDVTHFDLQATQISILQIDEVKAFSIMRGLSLPHAKTELMKAFELRQPAQIAIQPSWWKWLPLIPFNTSVELK